MTGGKALAMNRGSVGITGETLEVEVTMKVVAVRIVKEENHPFSGRAMR